MISDVLLWTPSDGWSVYFCLSFIIFVWWKYFITTTIINYVLALFLPMHGCVGLDRQEKVIHAISRFRGEKRTGPKLRLWKMVSKSGERHLRPIFHGKAKRTPPTSRVGEKFIDDEGFLRSTLSEITPGILIYFCR